MQLKVGSAYRSTVVVKIVTISRAQGTLTFPANFMLMAAMSPCPCGYCGYPAHECSGSPSMVRRYQLRMSGLFLDRQSVEKLQPTSMWK